MLLMLVSLLCCVPAATACLQCDRKIKLLIEDLTMSARSIKQQIEMKPYRDHIFEAFKESSRQRKGVIDATTLYRARTEYQNELNRYLNTEHTEQIGSARIETIRMLEMGRRILEKHLDIFIRDGLCPNKCGLLKRRVMDCSSCRYKIYICPSPSGQQDCGELPVQAEEGGQAVLHCFHPWHRLLLGAPEYHYSWARGVPGTEKLNESDFKALVVTDDSSVVLNQLHTEEQGTYRCSLQGQDGTVFYRVTFPLAVAALPDRNYKRPVVPPPSLPGGDDYSPSRPTADLLVPVVAMITALSLVASVGLTFVLGMMMSQRRAAGQQRRRTETRTHIVL
ncbi:hypothetical protein VZT92_004544 [Zoarces viviparus]|uniref:Ig-like domain-containing protein n=1 Tax=Zoarces viviparus TaxID=48416 RepID=A0AAW1FXF8_ZOAVI